MVCSSLNIQYQSTGVGSLPLLVETEPRRSIRGVFPCNKQFLMDVLVIFCVCGNIDTIITGACTSKIIINN